MDQNGKMGDGEKMDMLHEKIRRYMELEKEHFTGATEVLMFAQMQMIMMDSGLPMKDAPGFLRRAASLIEVIIKEKIMVVPSSEDEEGA